MIKKHLLSSRRRLYVHGNASLLVFYLMHKSLQNLFAQVLSNIAISPSLSQMQKPSKKDDSIAITIPENEYQDGLAN